MEKDLVCNQNKYIREAREYLNRDSRKPYVSLESLKEDALNSALVVYQLNKKYLNEGVRSMLTRVLAPDIHETQKKLEKLEKRQKIYKDIGLVGLGTVGGAIGAEYLRSKLSKEPESQSSTNQ